MTPVSPVMPGSESVEVVFGKNQPEYVPLPAVYINSPSLPVVTRWRLSDEERLEIANGADIVLQQLTFNTPLHPVHLQVCYPDQYPVLIEEPA